MTTEEKLQLINHLRGGFAKAVLGILKDENGLNSDDLNVDIKFMSVRGTPAELIEAAKNLGWQHGISSEQWYESEDNFGTITVFR